MLALLLAVVAGNQPLPALHDGEAAGIAADLGANPDMAQIAAAPGFATRDGRVLRIREFRLVDEGAACDGSGCTRYRFDRPWFGAFAGIVVGADENGDYLMVGTRDGSFVYVGAAPHPSPSGRYVFTGLGSDLNDESIGGVPNGSYVWRGADLARLRTIDDARIHFSDFVGWHGDDCVEFVGVPAYGTGAAARHYWLANERLDWTLHDRAPPACPAR